MKEESMKIQLKKTGRNVLITVIVLACVCAGLYIYDNMRTEEPEKAEFAAVNKICELATLRCYYHDVAEYEKQPNGFFSELFKYGYKKFWIEYSGIVDVGIDAGQVQVNTPDENGVVKVYVPEAKILNIKADPESMSEPVADTGIFTSITTAEKAEAFSQAQITMKSNAESDSNILAQAHDNAKELLKQYISRVGKQTGNNYTVEWLDEPVED